jgi:transcriptional regulator with PAS, ATPase and Fis domain
MHIYRFTIKITDFTDLQKNEQLKRFYQQFRDSGIEELYLLREQNSYIFYTIARDIEQISAWLHLYAAGNNRQVLLDPAGVLIDHAALHAFFDYVCGRNGSFPADPNHLLHIREEYNLALEEGAVGTILTKMYREGEKLGNMLQSDPEIIKNCISFPDVLLDIASKISDRLQDFQYLFLGSRKEQIERIIQVLKRRDGCKIFLYDSSFSNAFQLGTDLGCIPLTESQLNIILDHNTIIVDYLSSAREILPKVTEIISENKNFLYIYFDLSKNSQQKINKNLPNLFIQSEAQIRGLITRHMQNRVAYLKSFDRQIERAVNKFYDWLYSDERYIFNNIVSADRRMQKVFELIRRIAPSDISVLICGETGTGKELIARSIHDGSKRAKGQFIAVNCSAIPETLLESELFGYERGAFTGAFTTKKGLIELASGGTLFLDEIGDLPATIQVKLLRVLQEREILHIGGTTPTAVDIRLVTATNQDLEAMTALGKFRSDLYYRVNTVQINLPALRERKEDIPLLTKYFINRLNRRFDKHVTRISAAVQDIFIRYHWPGNIRELENIIERAFAVSIGDDITLNDLPARVREFRPDMFLTDDNNAFTTGSLREVEEARIRDLILKRKVSISEAVRILGIVRTTLWRKMKEYNINRDNKEERSENE